MQDREMIGAPLPALRSFAAVRILVMTHPRHAVTNAGQQGLVLRVIDEVRLVRRSRVK